MTTSLLVIREYLKIFYIKYEDYLVPFLKFLLALVSLLMINGRLGYMEQLQNPAAVMVVALFCSFMPKNFILLVSAVFVELHLYEVSLEYAAAALLIFLLLFLIYFRFSPGSTILVLITPMLFVLRIPYAAPILAGLLGNPISAVTVACGVLVYYMLSYMTANAPLLGSVPAESVVQRFRDIIDGIFGNKAMLVVMAAFVITVLAVYVIRRMNVDFSWTIAIVAGTLLDIVILLNQLIVRWLLCMNKEWMR